MKNTLLLIMALVPISCFSMSDESSDEEYRAHIIPKHAMLGKISSIMQKSDSDPSLYGSAPRAASYMETFALRGMHLQHVTTRSNSAPSTQSEISALQDIDGTLITCNQKHMAILFQDLNDADTPSPTITRQSPTFYQPSQEEKNRTEVRSRGALRRDKANCNLVALDLSSSSPEQHVYILGEESSPE